MTPCSSVHGASQDGLDLRSIAGFTNASNKTGGGWDATSTIHTDDDPVDELQAVRNQSKHETGNVRCWRIIMTVALLATAAAVTYTTYKSLADEQVSNFKTAFEQFSRTISNAAVNQQADLHRSFFAFSDQITTHVQSSGEVWPFLTIPFFNQHAAAVLEQSRAEGLLLMHIVPQAQRPRWENWTTFHYEAMVQEAHILENGNLDDLEMKGFNPFISMFGEGGFVPDKEREMHFPVWEYAPAPFTPGFVNWNALNDDVRRDTLFELKDELLYSDIDAYYEASLGVSFTKEEHEALHANLGDSDVSHPHSYFIVPVHKEVNNIDSEIVAVLSGAVAWDASLNNLLPKGVDGLMVVIANSCNSVFTYEVIGGDAIFRGDGDHHDAKYDSTFRFVDLSLSKNPKTKDMPGHCSYNMTVYPSQKFEDEYDTFTPEFFAIVVFATFIFVIAVFIVYDLVVYWRNEKLIENAARSNAIVSAIFPSTIRDRLITENNNQNGVAKTADKRIANLKNYLNGYTDETTANHKPLADLFLETTVMFADIAGFTAWSSVREPSQVFTFLERIFSSFDHIAKTRRVFKVETVGDCYVAATGIPDARKDHAVVMVRFAKDILTRTLVLTKELEVTHGPDTADLSLRIGINSGPVTAGVLRGERARFQLFGDTMNTASRIEHTGRVGRIHVSADTADCLRNCGKGHWLVKRENLVEAKGKGTMQTFWIGSVRDRDQGSHASSTGNNDFREVSAMAAQAGAAPKPIMKDGILDERGMRLVDWNVEMMLHIIRQVIARRQAITPRNGRKENGRGLNAMSKYVSMRDISEQLSPLDEVKEIIHLPEFDQRVASTQEAAESIAVAPVVINQLRSFVSNIASMYRPNDFHNFEHASHVTMSVIKLLARIVAPSDDFDDRTNDDTKATLHDHTYGITSDPLTQLACAFSAMIHDVDHVGVPNAQLVKEKTRIAHIYNNRSVAEQNSLVLSWELYMMDEYADLRECICPTDEELKRFRELVVNGVMATDIVDKELKQLRNNRWDKAFGDSFEESLHDARNRKATIVIEHLIQASDVAHTMQHWHVYRKWNERFFRECYAAYKAGRSESNPVEGWYKGELGFFDFYIIPLAKKLKDCGVFGKSSD
eukprot:CAMPEP_0119570456 /NCGR_PEP_ID=MMETSP1352-20130426/43621_1 /TAXON_ID=265584 /ORGANISM="Stauroneis constricta, Strain CCMP1120" /LENGTH=1121 /DNA_ID=CAMNT_0007620125 /DNA_START=581 /DNA_END=3943 /DNA_ORIENTATION=-